MEVLWLNDPLFDSRFSFVSMMRSEAFQLITLFICASDLELAYKYKMINNYGNIVAILVFFWLINFLLNLGNRYVPLRQLSTLIVFNLMVSFVSKSRQFYWERKPVRTLEMEETTAIRGRGGAESASLIVFVQSMCGSWCTHNLHDSQNNSL